MKLTAHFLKRCSSGACTCVCPPLDEKVLKKFEYPQKIYTSLQKQSPTSQSVALVYIASNCIVCGGRFVAMPTVEDTMLPFLNAKTVGELKPDTSVLRGKKPDVLVTPSQLYFHSPCPRGIDMTRWGVHLPLVSGKF